MREIIERYAEQLTPGERRAIWERLSNARVAESRVTRNWLRPALVVGAATAVAAVAFVFSLPRPELANLLRLKPAERREVGVRAGTVAPPPASEHAIPSARPEVPVRAMAPRAGRRDEVAITPPSTEPIALEPRSAAPATVPDVPPPPLVGGKGVITGRILDAQRRPLAFANVILTSARLGAATDENGSYRIVGVPPGTYSLRIVALGYRPELQQGIRVSDGPTAVADIVLSDVVVRTEKAVEVLAERRLVEVKQSATMRSVKAEELRPIPVVRIGQGYTTPGSAKQGDAVHVRGGRSGEVQFGANGADVPASPAVPAPGVTPAQPPVVPTTGGTKLPNDEAYDSMFFKNYGVNPFIATDEDALSTFAVDVDAASYTVTRRYLQLGNLPPADAVRVEEFVNFFSQGYPTFRGEDFRILMDGAPSPFGPGYQLLRIGIKGREIVTRDRKPAQLTFAIDVSGSMAREDRLELVKRALRLLVDQLRKGDRVGIVVYGTVGRVLLDPAALDRNGAPGREAGLARDADVQEGGAAIARGGNRQRILDAIEQLRPEGSTNAEDGLRLAYDMARRGYRPEAINRIVLCSDGVANVGRTGPESILARVRTEADRGIQLTTIGFGMGNYNDVLMEQLADKGDGNHYYVDDIREARRVFVENLGGTLQTIARDAKVQVEFDSTRVVRYRLLGFENRDVADRDFRNDKVDAGEIGAGHEVTALYEVKLAPNATQGTLATVRLRYARPEHEGAGAPQVREIEQRWDVAALGQRFEDASPRFRLDAAVAEFAEILRGSYWAKGGRLSDVLSVARNAARALHDDSSAEFVSLVEKAAMLSGRAKPGEPGESR